jgi:hypothetical protein
MGVQIRRVVLEVALVEPEVRVGLVGLVVQAVELVVLVVQVVEVVGVEVVSVLCVQSVVRHCRWQCAVGESRSVR